MARPIPTEKTEFDESVVPPSPPAGDITGGLRAVLNGTCEAIGIIPPSGEDENDKGLLPLLLEMEKRGGVGDKRRESKAILNSQMYKLKRVCLDEQPTRSLCLIVLVLSWCSEPAFLRNGCTQAITIIQKKESGMEMLNSTRTELLYSFRHILPGCRYEKKIEQHDGMLWAMLDKMYIALTQVGDTKRRTESDPIQDDDHRRWAAECELSLVCLAEKASEMANEGGGEAAVVRLWAFHTATALLCLQALLQSCCCFNNNRNLSNNQEDIENSITTWKEYRFCLSRAVRACCRVIPLRSAPKDAITQLAVAALQLSREHWKRKGRWDGGLDSASLIASALGCNYHSHILSEGCNNGLTAVAVPEVELSLISCWLQKNGPPLALVALARGVMSCCTSEESVLIAYLGQTPGNEGEKTMTTLPFTEEEGRLASSLLYYVLPSVLLYRCMSPDPILRHASLQVTQMWIHRCYQQSVLHAAAHRLYEVLITEAENIVIWNIDNPTRKASRLIIDSFEYLIRWRLSLDLSLTDIMKKITRLRNDRKDKYVVLSLLLDVAGPSRTLSMVPFVVRQLLIAIGNTANVGKAASSLLLRLLAHHEDWESDVAHALVSADERLCQRILEFFLPTAIKQHVHSVPRLCKQLIIQSNNNQSNQHQHLRLLLEVITLARQSGAFQEFEIIQVDTMNNNGVGIMTADDMNAAATIAAAAAVSSSFTLGSNDIERAYTCRDPRMRIATLSLLTAGLKRGSIPPSHEMHHLFQGLALCLKTSVSKECSEVVRLVRRLALGLRNAATRQSSSCQNEQQKNGCEQYAKRLGMMVLNSIYPGTPFEKEILGVQLVLALLECLCLPFDQVRSSSLKFEMTMSRPQPREFPLHEATASILCTPHAVKLLMVLLMSTWERTRQLAAELLENHMPTPLPGLEHPSHVSDLMTWGIFASSSVRSRDFDAGSLIVSLLFSMYAVKQGWLFESCETENADVGGPPKVWLVMKPEGKEDIIDQEMKNTTTSAAGSAPPRYFILQLLKVLKNRMKCMTAARMAILNEELPPLKIQPPKMAMSSLYHQRLPQAVGILVALKKCMGQVLLAHMDVTEWRSTAYEVYMAVLEAFDLALTVIAQNAAASSEQPSDEDLKQETSSCHRAQKYCSVGPVDSNYSIGAVNAEARSEFVTVTQQQQQQQRSVELDCRGYLLVNGTTPEEGSGVGGLHQQVVVGSWLMAKEAAFVLSDLVAKAISCSASPDAAHSSATASSMVLLTEFQVERVGHSFWNALLTMRHMGAISTVCNAFQKVCEALLRKCTIAPLAALPLCWLRRLFQCMREEDSQFVLRRSSGFATAFQAILRSEPRDGQPILLHEAMEKLIELAIASKSKYVDQENDDGWPGSIEQQQQPKEGWKARVHAINVLRMLIGDAQMPSDMLKFMTRSITVALEGFKDGMWPVRNSCLMLFAAIFRRVAVYPNASPSSPSTLASPRSLSIRTLYKFFPGLHPYLVDEIRLAASVPSTSLTQASCPVLFPILLLLAQLRTSGNPTELTAEGGGGGTETDNDGGSIEAVLAESSQTEFISLIQCTASSPEFAIREMGAKALASLVEGSDTCQFILSILETIPAEPPELLTNHNAIHGALLQVLALLQKNSSSTTASEPPIVNALLQRSWLTDPEMCKCPTVSLAMYRVLDYLSEDDIPSLRGLQVEYWKRSIGCFALLPPQQQFLEEKNSNFDETMLIPGQPELLFECAASWCFYSVSVLFHHVISAPPPPLDAVESDPDLCVTSRQHKKEMLSVSWVMNAKTLHCQREYGGDNEPSCSYLCLFSSKVLEIRSGAASGALKAIQGFSNITDEREAHIDCEGMRNLSDASLGAALCEDHPPTRGILMQVACMASVRLLKLSETFLNAWLQISELVESCMVEQHQSAPSDALELLGHCIRGMIRDRLEDCPEQLFVNWVDLLMRASNPNTPAALRRSASASLRAGYASILESCHLFSDGFIVARAHYVALILLNDDDEDIRNITAVTVAVGAPTHPLVEERAVRSVVESLGRLEGPAGLVMLFQVLHEVSLGAADAVKRFFCHTDYDGPPPQNNNDGCCSYSDAVFEDEEVNSHGEDTLLAREAARALILNFSSMTVVCLKGRCTAACMDAIAAILYECKTTLRSIITAAAHVMENDEAAKNSAQMNCFTLFGCGYDCRVFPKLMSALISAGVAVTLLVDSNILVESSELNGAVTAEMYGGGTTGFNTGVLEKSVIEVMEAGMTVMNLVAAGTLPPLHPSMEFALQHVCDWHGYTVEDIELFQQLI